jgi:hypothetical protein
VDILKKIVTILLVLFSVAGIVSAADLTGTATLNLNTIVPEEISHGFFDEIYDGSSGSYFGSGAVNNTKSSINIDGENSVGYYSFSTNLPNQVKVSFELSSLTNGTGSGVWYVPYQLSITKAKVDGTRFTESHSVTGSLGSSALATSSQEDPLSSLGGDVFTTSGSGLGYISLELKVTFNPGNSAVIAAGDYEGSIVATITTL